MTSLFDSESSPPSQEQLEEGAVLLRGFATAEAPALVVVTPGGYTMSVAMTNCGRVGWVSDRTGYRYDPVDPGTGAPWPAIPAAEGGFDHYDPDACLINRYVAGAKLKDAWAPIVSVSLGLPEHPLTGAARINLTFRKVF